MKVLVTGDGLVGRQLTHQLSQYDEVSVVSAVRKITQRHSNVDTVEIGDITKSLDWLNSIHNVDVIIHTIARVHIMNDECPDPAVEYTRVNTTATLNLARQAFKSGVKRFIFISSIKVNGEQTTESMPFTADDNHIPKDPYGLSKYEAEQGLLRIAAETGMEVVIVRPPLVYGPGVKANFESMIKCIKRGLPLPFGLVNNQRSLIALDNLVDFIIFCTDHKQTPQAANKIFLVSDDEDVSTSELLKKIACAYGVKLRLFDVPVGLMKFTFKLLGKARIADRLLGDLQVDCSKAKTLLGWKPVITMDEQLKKMADAEK